MRTAGKWVSAAAALFALQIALAHALAPRLRGEGMRFAAARRAAADVFWIAAVQDFPYNARDLGPARIGQARARILTALDLDPDFREIYPNAPGALMLWDDSAAARAVLDRGIERFPDEPWLRMLRGAYMALTVDSDPETAVRHLEIAAGRADRPPVAAALLALSYHRSGREPRAREVLAELAAGQGPEAAWARAILEKGWP